MHMNPQPQTAEDRRRELRLSRRAAVFIKVQSAAPEIGEADTLVMCRLLDISANGLKLRVDRELEPGAPVRLAVQFTGTAAPLHLMADLRWQHPCDGGYWESGFTLQESLQTDIVAWKRWVADTLMAPDA